MSYSMTGIWQGSEAGDRQWMYSQGKMEQTVGPAWMGELRWELVTHPPQFYLGKSSGKDCGVPGMVTHGKLEVR